MSKYLTCKNDLHGRATLCLNRPERHNALNGQLIAELTLQLQQLEADPETRLVILSALGDSFCAGADLKWLNSLTENSPAANRKEFSQLAELLHMFYHHAKPTLTLVQGAVYGGGVGLVAVSDIVLASEQASFCLSEVKLGLIPATISPYLLAAIGARQAKRYILSAEPISAHEALRIGLVHELVPASQLSQRGHELSQQLLSNAPSAVEEAKKLVNELTNQPMDTALPGTTSARIADLLTSNETREGLQAFLEKRPPNWLEDR